MLMGMPAELRHKIHDAIDEYIISRTDPEDKNVLYSPYLAIKEQIDYDKQSYYNQVVERNRKNGKKGGRPKNNPNNPLGFQKPKKADTVTDTVTVCINNKLANLSIHRLHYHSKIFGLSMERKATRKRVSVNGVSYP